MHYRITLAFDYEADSTEAANTGAASAQVTIGDQVIEAEVVAIEDENWNEV